MNSLPANSTELERPNWVLRGGIALCLALSFGMVAHHWNASITAHMAAGGGFQNRENKFAKQQATTTSSSAVGFILLGGMGAVLAWKAPPGRRRWLHPLSLLLAAYVSWCAASYTWSDDAFLTLRKLAILLLMLAGAYGVALRCTLADIVWSVILCLTGTLLVGFVAEISQGMFRPWRGEYRFAGTLDPNGIGLEAATLALAAWIVPYEGRRRTFVRVALVGLAVTVVIMTKSRTTLAALVAGGMLAMLLRARGQQRWLIVSGAVAAACVLGLLLNFVSVADIQDSASVASMGRKENLSSLTGRWPLWQAVLKEADNAPILGFGYGAFWSTERIYRYSDAFLWHIPHAHNTYLDLVLATGVVGLVLYLLWVIATAVSGWLRYDRVGNPADLFVACYIAFCLVHGLAESKIPGAGVTTFLLYACGASLALKPAVAPALAETPESAAPRPAPPLWQPARRLSV